MHTTFTIFLLKNKRFFIKVIIFNNIIIFFYYYIIKLMIFLDYPMSMPFDKGYK